MARFVLLVLVSFGAYFAAFRYADKPLTDGEMRRLYDQKRALLSTPGSGRVFVLAGSNGRFSHSCKVIEAELHRPCENLSIAAGIGLDFLFASYLPGLRSGDIVYMPLEFEQYEADKARTFSGPDNVILLKQEPALLQSLGWDRSAHAWFYADERYFIRSAVESALAKKGVQRRFTDTSVNSNGDQQGHTAELARAYRASVYKLIQAVPPLDLSARGSFAELVILDFLRAAHAKGVRVIGGLPTTFDDTTIPTGTLAYLQGLYARGGQSFLILPNQSHYPRSCFFDIAYHLNEGCQAEHSKILARELASRL
jgi:hypothetical protein